ncbi:Hypothetical predicted protein [Podarcis lilfordi]|uniref:Uncharacterized protein n=1 Tax=Podarcis lilfordi TaxID=74358 RepID=A0AA35PUX5_9SAUR|nr:Hypothetical predicted protein [Podarcis lilfordi]
MPPPPLPPLNNPFLSYLVCRSNKGSGNWMLSPPLMISSKQPHLGLAVSCTGEVEPSSRLRGQWW